MRYRVKRYIVEEFEIEATSREDAKAKSNLDVPNYIRVLKETIVKSKNL